jgi:hypothetical protein
MELNELCGNLDNALHYPLAVPPHRVTLHLENGASPNHFGGLHILEFNITTRDTTCTDNCPEICSGRENHLLNKSLACLSPAIRHLLKGFMLFLTVWITVTLLRFGNMFNKEDMAHPDRVGPGK